MNKEEYLKSVNVDSVKDLTDKQVEAFFVPWNKDAAFVEQADYALSHKNEIGYDKIISAMRKAIDEGKDFVCYRTERGEGENPTSSQWIVEAN